jgi:hypothetical protein
MKPDFSGESVADFTTVSWPGSPALVATGLAGIAGAGMRGGRRKKPWRELSGRPEN